MQDTEVKRMYEDLEENNLGSYVNLIISFIGKETKKSGVIHICRRILPMTRRRIAFYAGMETICFMWETENM